MKTTFLLLILTASAVVWVTAYNMVLSRSQANQQFRKNLPSQQTAALSTLPIPTLPDPSTTTELPTAETISFRNNVFSILLSRGCKNHGYLREVEETTLENCLTLCISEPSGVCTFVAFEEEDKICQIWSESEDLETQCNPQDDILWTAYTLLREGKGTKKKKKKAKKQENSSAGIDGRLKKNIKGVDGAVHSAAETGVITSVSEEDLQDGAFVSIRAVEGGRYIGLAYEGGESGVRGVALQNVLRVERLQHKGDTFFALKSSLGTYLSAETNDFIGIDRKKVKSLERFAIEFPQFLGGEKAVLRCAKSRKLLSFDVKKGLFRAKSTTLDAKSVHFTINTVTCTFRECDTKFNHSQIRSLIRENRPLGELEKLSHGIPLFTSPKPAYGAKQALIFETWAKLRYFTPLILSESEEVVATTQALGVTAAGNIEVQKDYGQPTYRGLFAAAFKTSGSELAMYSNADILYTPSLEESIDAVLAFWRAGVHAEKPLLVIGQRTNVEVPEGLSIEGSNWAEQIERLEELGVVFQPDAEVCGLWGWCPWKV